MKKLLILASLLAMPFAASEAFAGGHSIPKDPPTNNGLSVDPSYWFVRFSPGVANPVAPCRRCPGWQVTIPTSAPGCAANNSCSHLDYVQTIFRDSVHLNAASAIQMTFTLVETGTPVFDWHTETGNTCSFPVHVRALIQVFQTSLCIGDPPMPGCEYERWWSNPAAVEIGPAGTFTLTVPLDPSQWSSVYGEQGNASPASLAGWHNALNTVGMLGMTFGGGCFFGHGVFIDSGTGTATFTCTGFRLLP